MPLRAPSPTDAMAAGVAYVPEDRAARRARSPSLTVGENLSLTVIGDYWRAARLARRRGATRRPRAGRRRSAIKAASETAPLRIALGRQPAEGRSWPAGCAAQPRLLLLDEPTQGVDVGARVEIYELIRRAVDSTARPPLVASSDFEELERASATAC